MLKLSTALALLLACAACTPSDQRQAHHDLDRTGQAVRKELKNDTEFMKEEFKKARVETQQGAAKLKEKAAETRQGAAARNER